MHPLPAPPTSPPKRPASLWLMALKVAGTYAVAGSLWIVLSDLAVAWRTGIAPETEWLQTAKGLGFVWVTAALLVLLVLLSAAETAGLLALWCGIKVNKSKVRVSPTSKLIMFLFT